MKNLQLEQFQGFLTMKYTPSPTASIGSIENCELYAKEEDIVEQVIPGQQ